ncbi:uncharacterized protein LOC119607441 [Lucilia sericata]|uniref:uncharacterized protein LOC119607441 n=1 Tax=Lucilia sericata TaxID=13632 RepID=UPI0018A7FFAE|nr:uncharacterized protein LOC119607441 [Lucilia sericata]
MKIAKFTNNYIRLFAHRNKAIFTSYKPVTKLSCSLFYQYQNVTNYFAMFNTKLFRHAQTQHGDDTVDIDNIVLCKATVFALPGENSFEDNTLENADRSASDNESENLNTDNNVVSDADNVIKSESPQCVWFFEVEDVNVYNSKVGFYIYNSKQDLTIYPVGNGTSILLVLVFYFVIISYLVTCRLK